MFAENTRRLLLAASLISFLAPPWAEAVKSSIWRVQTQADFGAGQPESISVNSRGEVTLAPNLQEIADTGEPYVWCLARDRDGNLYAGTGNGGKVFRIDADGELSLLADLEEPDVLSLAVDGNGRLYAGTSATGRIYRIAPSGASTRFYETGESYVWSMSIDPDGTLYAGTGSAGKIHRIDSEGTGDVFYDTPETHIISLIQGGPGHLYAGGEGSGIVYRISSGGEAFVLYDAAEQEVSCLALDAAGNLYAGVIGGGAPGPAGPSIPMVVEAHMRATVIEAGGAQSQDAGPDTAGSGEAEPQQAGPVPPTAMATAGRTRPGRPGGTGPGSALYRIAPDGVVSELWRAADKQLLSLALDPGGDLVLGTGGDGHFYQVDPRKAETGILSQSSDAQVTAMVAGAKGEILAGCSNMGRVLRLGPRYASEGTLASVVHDASTWARWGRVSWEGVVPGGTEVEFSTRSGNTEKPDSTWSSWTETTGGRDGSIGSPNARFVQWRAELESARSGTSPVLRAVSVSYLQRNLQPRVNAITISPRAAGGQRNSGGAKSSPAGAAAGSPQPRHGSGSLNPSTASTAGDPPITGPGTISWQAADGNGDQLRYALYFRAVGEGQWKLLEDDLRTNSHTWDSATFPDDLYVVRVVAQDDLSNVAGSALAGERISDPFLVDNTPPAVGELKVEVQGLRATVTGVAMDATGPLREGAYAIDGAEWRVFFPADDIFDSGEERFSFQVDLPSAGEHTLVVRVEDLAGLVGARKAIVGKPTK